MVSLLGGGWDEVHFFALEGFFWAWGRVAGVIVGVCTVVGVVVVLVWARVILVASPSRVIIW